MGVRAPLHNASRYDLARRVTSGAQERHYRAALERISELCGRLEVGGANAHRIVAKIDREAERALGRSR